MATTQMISIGEYLGSVYRPDVDYVDGYIEERNVGDFDHANIQGQLHFLLRLRQEDWHVLILPEVRVKVAATRFRIPDVCVLRGDIAQDPTVTEAPLLCLEVLSPRDSVTAMRSRAQDYFDLGVPEVWIFDPQTRTAYICLPDSMTEQKDGILRLEGTPVELSIAEVFKPLHRKS
jgi:Uma2 family endonuclease